MLETASLFAAAYHAVMLYALTPIESTRQIQIGTARPRMVNIQVDRPYADEPRSFEVTVTNDTASPIRVSDNYGATWRLRVFSAGGRRLTDFKAKAEYTSFLIPSSKNWHLVKPGDQLRFQVRAQNYFGLLPRIPPNTRVELVFEFLPLEVLELFRDQKTRSQMITTLGENVNVFYEQR